jgi:hypothetical protein
LTIIGFSSVNTVPVTVFGVATAVSVRMAQPTELTSFAAKNAKGAKK